MESYFTSKPIRTLALTGLAVVLTLILAVACVMPPASEVISDTFTVSDTDKLVIDIPNGLVELTGIDGATEIEIVAEVQNPDHWRYSATQVRGLIEVTAKKKGLGWSTRDKVNLKVSLPTQFQLNVSNSNGDIDAHNVTGNTVLRSSNGKITVEDGQGEFDLKTSNGDIDARNVTGNIVIHSSNGRITVEDGQGEFDLKSSNGDINFGGEMIPQSENEFFTNNGSITVILAGEPPNVRIQADLGNGRIHLSHPVTEVGISTPKHLDVVIGSGTANLTLETGNGSIRIE